MNQTETMAMREKMFTLRMNEEESTRLDAIAKHYGLNAAGVLRVLIKEKHDQIVGDDVRREDRRWYQFTESVRDRMQLAGVPNLKVFFDQSNLNARLTDGKRERIVSAEEEPEPFVVLNNWPGSFLECDDEGHEYDSRTGLNAKGEKVAKPHRFPKKS